MSLTNTAAGNVPPTLGNNGLNNTYSGVLSGGGSITKVGIGMQILSGANSYTGTTTISGGTLQFGNATASGNVGGGAITDNGTLAFNRTDTYTVPDTISGSGGIDSGRSRHHYSFRRQYFQRRHQADGWHVAVGQLAGIAKQHAGSQFRRHNQFWLSNECHAGWIEGKSIARIDQRIVGRRAPDRGKQLSQHHVFRCAERRGLANEDRRVARSSCRFSQ